MVEYAEKHGIGTTITGATSGLLGNLTSIEHSGQTVNMKDVTDMDNVETEEMWRRFIEGLHDPGEISLEGHYSKGTIADLMGVCEAGKEEWTIAFPDGGTFKCDAFMTSFNPFSSPHDNKITWSGNLKLSGAITFTV